MNTLSFPAERCLSIARGREPRSVWVPSLTRAIGSRSPGMTNNFVSDRSVLVHDGFLRRGRTGWELPEGIQIHLDTDARHLRIVGAHFGEHVRADLDVSLVGNIGRRDGLPAHIDARCVVGRMLGIDASWDVGRKRRRRRRLGAYRASKAQCGTRPSRFHTPTVGRKAERSAKAAGNNARRNSPRRPRSPRKRQC